MADEKSQSYLELAQCLDDGRLTENDLAGAVDQLPPPNLKWLHSLARQAEVVALNQPSLAWAIIAVAQAAVQKKHPGPTRQTALVAWYLARAANHWVRPSRVEAAIQQARDAFTALNEAGWLAACTWQLNALPWTRPNFQKATAELEEALSDLQQASLTTFIPHCRLALAYAQLLTGAAAQAQENISLSQRTFTQRGDRRNQARCWLTQSSLLRRQSSYAEATAYLEKALPIFHDSPIDLAKAYYQLAYCYLRGQDNYQAAQRYFQHAASLFEAADLPLWAAQCYTGLAESYNNAGQLLPAAESLQRARPIYGDYQIKGLHADNFLDTGTLEMLGGNLTLACDYFHQADACYTQVGNTQAAAMAAIFLGEVYRQLGRYQFALHHLERAQAHLQASNALERLAECDLRLADLWNQLGRPDLAEAHLEKATPYYQQTGQLAFLTAIYNRRIELLLDQNQAENALPFCRQALAQSAGLPIQTITTQRLWGELLCALGRSAEAQQPLAAAVTAATEMGLAVEQVACQIALGQHHAQLTQAQPARQAWERAWNQSQDVMPHLGWIAAAGLARLAEEAGKLPLALSHYQDMVYTLAHLRRGIWQPSLAGAYLRRPVSALDRAIRLAAHLAALPQLLTFVEEGKAQTIASRLIADQPVKPAGSPLSQQAADLAATIRWQQTHFQTRFGSNRLQMAGGLHFLAQLRQNTKRYDALLDRLEREATPAAHFAPKFDLEQFRHAATKALGAAWVALDYYLAGSELFCLVVTPHRVTLWQQPANSEAELALETCLANRQLSTPAQLASLARWLLPGPLLEHLTGDPYLLIAPHGRLHQVPWAALPFGPTAAPLAAQAVPVVVPSLGNLTLLWQRPLICPAPPRHHALFLAISQFQERHPPLRQALSEIETIKSLTKHGQSLTNEQATWQSLTSLRSQNGLTDYAFLHVASHASYDSFTGRLSGIALYDQDLWQDQLWEIAPLPGLIVLSACSGSQSLVYEGDEHAGLTTTCLAAGAQTVIGSLWPIIDGDTADLMPAFYHAYLAGHGAARSLTLAQRSLGNAAINKWGSFLCIGQP